MHDNLLIDCELIALYFLTEVLLLLNRGLISTIQFRPSGSLRQIEEYVFILADSRYSSLNGPILLLVARHFSISDELKNSKLIGTIFLAPHRQWIRF